MEAKIIGQPAHAFCGICYTPEIAKLCHHCGRPLCREHLLPPGRQEPVSGSWEFSYLADSGIPSNQAVVHCDTCIHEFRAFAWLRWGGAAIVVFGVAVLMLARLLAREEMTVAGAGITLVGVSVAFTGLWLRRKLFRKALPPYPLLADTPAVTLLEQYRGEVHLTPEGHYSVEMEEPQGTITLSHRLTERDRQRLTLYRKRFRLNSNADVSYHAGYLVVGGRPGIRLEDADSGQINVIPLKGKVSDCAFLARQEGRRDQDLQSTSRYLVMQDDGKRPGLPVQIIPSLPEKAPHRTLPEDAQHRTLELTVQVSPEWGDVADVGSAAIESLELRAPQKLSAVLWADPSARYGPRGEEQVVHWEDVKIEFEQQQAAFKVRFGDNIKPECVLHGHLCVTLEDVMSRFTQLVLYYPWGDTRTIYATANDGRESISEDSETNTAGQDPERPDTSPQNGNVPEIRAGKGRFAVQTRVDVEFTLHLNSLLFQEIVSESKSLSYKGVVPSSQLISSLSGSINKRNKDTYVRRVVENPPTTGVGGAHITMQYWEVAGRHCERGYIFPIDFHLAISGKDVHGKPGESSIQVDMTTQAVVGDQNMRGLVRKLLDGLEDAVAKTLGKPAAGDEADRGMPTRPERDPEVRHILELVNKLDDALLNKTIDENRYEKMYRRYRIELERLGYELE